MRTRRLAASLLTGLIVVSTLLATSCGTLLYPERRGQHGGHLDATVVLLDAIGLLFFVIPGLIAFVVDFNNGTIYLPPGHDHHHHLGLDPANLDDAIVIRLPPEEMTRERIAAIVSEHLGRPVDLDAEGVEVRGVPAN